MRHGRTPKAPGGCMAERTDFRRCIERAREGDANAWSRLFVELEPKVYRAGRRVGLSHEEAQDLVQRVLGVDFPLFLRRFRDWRSWNAFVRWVERIAVRKALDLTRRRARRREQFGSAVGAFPVSEHQIPCEAPRIEAGIDLARILGSLPRRLWVVAHLHLLEGYSHSEIAVLLGISENASRSRLARARRRIRRSCPDRS